MSINFSEEMNEQSSELLKKLFGENLIAMDNKIALIDDMQIKQEEMKELANVAKQPVEVQIHREGEVKIFSDGTRYRVTNKGWIKELK